MKKRGFGRDFFNDKKGQVTIFIIIAVVVVGLAVLIYFLIPKPEVKVVFDEGNPQGFIQSCIEDKIKETINIISLQGGSIEPEFYFEYNEVKMNYLCYTNQNFDFCVVQQPLLKQHIQEEVENEINDYVIGCFDSLKESYERRNYEVQMEPGETILEILPKRVVVNFNYVLNVAKAGQTNKYNSFRVVLNNNLYEFISIADSIVEWESSVGNADTRMYMSYYPHLRVDKNLRDDETKIYVITDRNTEDKFQFASRSLTLPTMY